MHVVRMQDSKLCQVWVGHVDARKKAVEAKETVGHLKAHLRAWDKNHENVQNRGHSLRAEMKVLSRDIYAEQSIEDILGKE